MQCLSSSLAVLCNVSFQDLWILLEEVQHYTNSISIVSFRGSLILFVMDWWRLFPRSRQRHAGTLPRDFGSIRECTESGNVGVSIPMNEAARVSCLSELIVIRKELATDKTTYKESDRHCAHHAGSVVLVGTDANDKRARAFPPKRTCVRTTESNQHAQNYQLSYSSCIKQNSDAILTRSKRMPWLFSNSNGLGL